MTKIPILFLIGNLGVGGKERQLVELIKNISTELFEIHLIVKNVNAHYLDKVNLQKINLIDLQKDKFGFSFLLILFNYIKKNKIKIVHSWASPTSFYVSLLKPIFRNNFYFIDGSIRQILPAKIKHYSLYAIQRYVIKLAANLIIANSKAGLKSYNIIENAKVIHNGFDIKRISNITDSEIVRNNNGIDTKYTIGMVARFDPMKDYNTFLDAAIEICRERDDISFIAIGGGVLFNEYLAKYSNVHKNIRILGEQKNVEDFINIFDICVLCSFGEAISNALMEYMSLGKPVIVTEGGGTAELVINGNTGFIIPQNNKLHLVEKINTLLNDEQLRFSIGLQGKERIIKEFSVEKMVMAYSEIYKGILR